ncbi:MAG: hypothetical protein J6X54_02030 [Treponema sp.]|nr:hypothetical protein [Treponema sp.]
MIWKLFKLLASNVYDFSAIKDGFKKGPKGIIKSLGLILLFGFVFVYFLIFFGNLIINIYNTLEPENATNAIPGLLILFSMVFTFYFGFTAVSVSYYTGSGEEQLMSLPLSPRQLLSAKILMSVASELPMNILFVCVGTCVYGYKEGLLSNPSIYIGMIVVSIVNCLLFLSIIYGIFVLLLTLIPALRKKSVLQGIATVFLLSFVAVFSFITSSSDNAVGEKIRQSLAESSLIEIARNSVVGFYGSALTGNWLALLTVIAIGAIIFFGLVPLYSKLYKKSLDGFSNVRSKKMDNTQAEKLIQSDSKRNSVLKALYLRDIRTVFREPAFFANGPLMVFLLPAICIISILTSTSMMDKQIFDKLQTLIQKFTLPEGEELMKIIYIAAMGTAAFISLFTSMVNVAATSFSREGKAIHDLQAMPIEPGTIVFAKFWHAITYSVIGSVIINGLLLGLVIYLKAFFILPKVAEIIVMNVVVTMSFSVLFITIDMFYDTLNPKLNWENPQAAVKNNMNALLSFVTNLVLDVIVYSLIFAVFPKNYIGFILSVVIILVLAIPAAGLYFKYAAKKVSRM